MRAATGSAVIAVRALLWRASEHAGDHRRTRTRPWAPRTVTPSAGDTGRKGPRPDRSHPALLHRCCVGSCTRRHRHRYSPHQQRQGCPNPAGGDHATGLPSKMPASSRRPAHPAPRQRPDGRRALRPLCNCGPENYFEPWPDVSNAARTSGLDAAAAVIQSVRRRGSPPNLTGPSQRVRHEAKGTESSSRCQATRSGTELLGVQAWIAESHDSGQEVQALGA